MKIILFYHSIISDWNHGNAHFLRGIYTELLASGHDVKVFETENSWSFQNLVHDYGDGFEEIWKYYPLLKTNIYDPDTIDLQILSESDLVIVHEWNDHKLVKRIGEIRKNNYFKLLFHDTHHRAVSDKSSMAAYDLSNYDGVLAFGNVIRDIYLQQGWTSKAWTWHEAADMRIFQPLQHEKEGDLVWIGNWGDEERTSELFEFLINPVKELGLKAKVYGVRYPEHALKALAEAGIEYGGYLPNYKAPEVFSKYKVTVHIPRKPYVESLPGIPTIRPFEALSCGIPLVSAPWNDSENMFLPGKDYLIANNGNEMKYQLLKILNYSHLAPSLIASGLNTIKKRHTCSHRVKELMKIVEEIVVPLNYLMPEK